MNDRLIPNDKISELPLETKLLVHCINDPEDDVWLVCTLAKQKDGDCLYLYDVKTRLNLTYLVDLDGFCNIYEYNEEDAKKHVEDSKKYVKEIQKQKSSSKSPRFVFDKEWMAIMDTQKNRIVCLIDTERPGLLESKLNELLNLANREAD